MTSCSCALQRLQDDMVAFLDELEERGSGSMEKTVADAALLQDEVHNLARSALERNTRCEDDSREGKVQQMTN